MAMKKSVLTVVAASAAAWAFAQENETPAEAEGQASAEAASAAAPKAAKIFTTLPFCRLAEGAAEVLQPFEQEWTKAEEGRFYPLGSRYRTHENGKLTLAFGPESRVMIEGDSEFATRVQSVSGGSAARTIELCRGTVSVDLARNTPVGSFFVSAPGFTAKNLAGESRYVYEKRGDGDFVSVRCVTGTLGLEGLHFDIAELRAANELHVRSTGDQLTTFLYGISGDVPVRIDRGLVTKPTIGDEGERKEIVEKGVLDWRLSPETKVRIDRLRLAVDGPMSVSVMTFDAAGELRNNYAFAEGHAEVNSGELVAAPKQELDEVAKRAAEATETSAADVEETKADDSEDEAKKDEKKDEKKDDE